MRFSTQEIFFSKFLGKYLLKTPFHRTHGSRPVSNANSWGGVVGGVRNFLNKWRVGVF